MDALSRPVVVVALCLTTLGSWERSSCSPVLARCSPGSLVSGERAWLLAALAVLLLTSREKRPDVAPEG